MNRSFKIFSGTLFLTLLAIAGAFAASIFGDALAGGAVLLFSPVAFTQNPYRQVYDLLKRAPYISSKVITMGFMRSITSLGTNAATGTKITFNIKQSDGTLVASENRLNNSDSFFSLQHRFGVGKTLSGVSANTLVPEYFPNAYIFTDATELAALKTLWWEGLLNVTINSTVYYDSFPLYNFVDTQWKEKALPLTTAGTNVYSYSSVKGNETALRDLVPTVFYNGNDSIAVSASLIDNATVAWGANGTATNYAVYENFGFYIKGGALNTDSQVREFMSFMNKGGKA